MLKQALAIKPEAPDLWNNLAAAYMRAGKQKEGNAIIRRLYEQHPDHLFARINMANMRVQEDRLDEAQALLLSLVERTRLRTSPASTAHTPGCRHEATRRHTTPHARKFPKLIAMLSNSGRWHWSCSTT